MSGNGDATIMKIIWGALWEKTSPYYLPSIILHGATTADQQIQGPLGNLTVSQVPEVQLMKSHDLASWLPVKTGYLSIRFSDLDIQGLETATSSVNDITYTSNPSDPLNKGHMRATITFGDLNIDGNYVVLASGLAGCALDTAGALSFLGPLPAGGGSVDGDSDGETDSGDQQLQQYLEAARAQRTKLWQTPNGGQLMDTFYEHNETYNFVFQNNKTMQAAWSLDQNKHFMQSTYQASQSDSVVNDSVYGSEKTTYNENAFTQQLTLYTTTKFYSSSDSDKYALAADAAMNFKGPVQSTGNTMDTIQPLKVSEVYTAVATYKPAAGPTAAGGVPELTEREKAVVADVEAKLQSEAGEGPAPAGGGGGSATLIQGTCGLNISQAQLTLDADLDFSDVHHVVSATLTVSFPVPTITIHNISDWTAGKLSSIGHDLDQHFDHSDAVRSLVHDKIVGALEGKQLSQYLTTAINNALQKKLGSL